VSVVADMSEKILRVIEPGLSTTVQDCGRFGHGRYGVSRSGAIDRMALGLANHLVGNSADEAALEMTMIGGVYEVLAPRLAVGLVGADMPLTADGTPLAPLRTHVLSRGMRLGVGAARSGLRAYLAVAGGIAVDRVLGSRSTHLRSAMGGFAGRALAAGDELPGAQAAEPLSLRLRSDRRLYFGGVVRLLPGPQVDAFETHALTVLTEGRYALSTQLDRMAANLDGPPLPFRDGFNIVSDGIVAGSIQVPGHGRPLVLLADCQTTGGFPKIATVVTPDIARIGQRRPHERVRFQLVSADEAEHANILWAGEFARLERYFEPVG